MPEKPKKPSNENLNRLRETLGKDLATFVLKQRSSGKRTVIGSSESSPPSKKRIDEIQKRLLED